MKNKPLKAWFTKLLENMLSISVAVFDVILVGRVIKRKEQVRIHYIEKFICKLVAIIIQ